MICNWPRFTIQELIDSQVITVQKDGNHGSNYPRASEFGDKGVAFLTAKLLDDAGNIDFAQAPRLSEEKASKFKFGFIEKDDVLLSHNATVGRVAIVPNYGEKVLIGTSLTHYRLNSEKLLPQYLAAFFTSKDFQNQLAAVMSQTTRNQVPITAQRKLEVVIPPIKIQKQLTRISGSIIEKISLNTQTNQTLEQMAQAIFKSWFVDFDPVKAKMNGEQPEGMDEVTASLFPEKLVESELGLIPEGWEVEPLKNVSRVINGRAYKNTEFKEEGTPIIRIQNLTGKGKTVYSDLDLPEDKLVEHGDLIFAWSATFGPHLWRGPKSIYHYHIWKMDVNEKRFGKYLLFMHLARLTDYLKNQGTGSIFTHLTKAIMESQKLVVPSEPIVEAFSKVVTPLFAQIDSLHKENQVLEKLRDTLLPKLLSGEIELGKCEDIVN
ncbi:restriction endonuclease subunit S [Photobacterium damselae]|uniref:restriction endonuclease subunit S n=1 Tax=Photobacterium damselae TaxID=38293 RepID=UPI0025430A7E|nr:restriction endonuclease subunit S [Photobacterium damselae]WIH19881.1 restriction endonuclease subunit S [Photobacterium damselae]